MDAVRVEGLDELGRSPGARNATSVERSSSGGLTTSTRSASRARQRSATRLRARTPRPDGFERGEQSRERRRRPPARGRSGRRPASGRRSRRARTRPVRGSSEPTTSRALRVGDDERAGRIRPAEPLLARDREVVEAGRVDGDRAHRLRAVDEHGNARLVPQLAHGQHAPGRPDHLGQREQPRSRRDGGANRVGLGRDDDDPRARDGRARRAGRSARPSSSRSRPPG